MIKRIRAALIYPIERNKKGWVRHLILALKKHKVGAGKLTCYGGKEEEEDGGCLIRTAIREFQEESGALTQAEHLRKVAIIDFYEAGKHTFECHLFLCEKWEGTIVETEEMGPPERCIPSNLPYSGMMGADIRFLPLLLTDRTLRAVCCYDKDQKNLLDFWITGPLP